jgi:PAS domain S-box-containing protein
LEDINKTKTQLVNELTELRQRNVELSRFAGASLNSAASNCISHFGDHIHLAGKIIDLEHRQSQQSLRQSNKKYNSLFASIIEGLVLFEIIFSKTGKPIDYVILDVNPAYESMTGFKRSNAVGSKASELYKMGKPSYIENFAEVITAGRPVSFETYFLPLDKHFFISVFLLERNKYAAIFSDITEQKKMEVEQKNSQQKLNSIVNKIPDIIYRLDNNCTITFINNAVKRYGYSPKELINTNIFDIVHPDYKGKALYRINERRTGDRSTKSLELKLLTKNNYSAASVNNKSTDIKNTPVFLVNAEGLYSSAKPASNNFKGTQGIATEITGRKQTEIELHKNNRRIKMLNECNKVLIRTRKESDLLKNICSIIIEIGGYRSSWIGYAEDDKKKTIRPAAQAGFDEKYFKTINTTLADTEGSGSQISMAIKTGEPFIITNILDDSEFSSLHKGTLKPNYASAIALPLINNDDTFGVLNIYSVEPDAFQDKEVSFLLELANDLAYGIVTIRERTGHKQALEALRQSEQNFKIIFSNALDVILIIDIKSGLILKDNQIISHILGYEEGYLIGKPFWILFPEKSQRSQKDLIKKLRVQGSVFESQQFLRSDASVCTMDLTATIIPWGKDKAILATMRDVTERRLTEKALQESEKRYRQLVEISPDAIIVQSRGRIVLINTAGMELLGAKNNEQLVRKPILSFIHPDYLEAVKKQIQCVAKERTAVPFFEQKLIRLDGAEVDAETAINPFSYQNKPACQILARDITKRKQVEKELSRLASVVEQSSESIVITGLDGKILYVNPAFEKISGYKLSKVLGKTSRILKSGKQDDKFYKNLWNTISAGKSWTGTFINKQKNGSFYYINAIIFPIKDNSGNIINYAAVQRDITGEKKLEAQLYQSQKLEAIGQLTGGIAHDFNNILTVINGYAEIALAKMDYNNPLFSKIEQISKGGQRAGNLVRQLLAFSRKQIIDPKIICINTVIIELDKMLRRLIGEDINLQTKLGEKIHMIKADPGQIEQILINLAVNARDAIHQKENHAEENKIIIETNNVVLDKDFVSEHAGSHIGNHVLISVSDTGSGMNNKTKDKIFEPFFTTKKEGKGTGLGLSTVYGIVKQNNGCIYVYSEPGCGTTFRIYWPCSKEKQLTDDKERETKQIDTTGSETILIVEDDYNVRKFAFTALKLSGYKVYESDNGLHAIEMVKEKNLQIDFLISDVVMPKMGGLQLAEKLKNTFPSIKVLYTSGYTDEYIVQHGELVEGINYLQKPYTVNTLTKKIRTILDNS